MIELGRPGPLKVQHRVGAVLVPEQGEVVHAEAWRRVSHAQFLSAHSAQTRALTIDKKRTHFGIGPSKSERKRLRNKEAGFTVSSPPHHTDVKSTGGTAP
ncbi:hypothetical protein GCM10010307_31200 [Streptomyces vastus]|uniref:Uncharacterized protein n=1 Tax=Streptomyces vastus TaxID=285451 RepID=A0ABN3QUM0_9ACTN